jgi:hypothetical protein
MEPETGFFGVRDMRADEIAARIQFTKVMLFASAAASLSIVGLCALFVRLIG